MNYLQEKLSESKYHQWLGLKVISYEKNILHVVLPFREEFFGTKEEINIHGGIISTLADAATCFVVMIIKKDSPWASAKVRKAMNYAVNKDLIVKTILKGYARVVATNVGPTSFGYNPNLSPYP